MADNRITPQQYKTALRARYLDLKDRREVAQFLDDGSFEKITAEMRAIRMVARINGINIRNP